MKFVTGTSIEDLSASFMEWQKGARQVKVAPNTYVLMCDSQRFGQYFWNQYGRDDETFPALFYERDAGKAYQLAYHEIAD